MFLPDYSFEYKKYESRPDVEYCLDKELYLLIEKRLRAGFSGVHGRRYFNCDGERVLTHDVDEKLKRLSVTQYLANAEIMFDENRLWKKYLEQQMMLKLGM